jgi:hypothetical protein
MSSALACARTVNRATYDVLNELPLAFDVRFTVARITLREFSFERLIGSTSYVIGAECVAKA